MESGAVKTQAPLWLWPNLLSLDAPIVAVLWQLLFARCFRVPLSLWPAVVLMATVWLIYSADRVLDAKRGLAQSLRHRFYQRNGRFVVALWTFVIPTTGWLVLEHFPRALFERGLLLLGLVCAYLIAVHLFDGSIFRKLWFKETAVGILFALGVSVTSWNGIHTPADAATIALFAALCTINCVAIEEWETSRWDLLQWEPRPAGWPVAGFAVPVALIASMLFFSHRPILAGAEVLSAAALLILNRVQMRLSPNAIRVLADVSLLTPLVFLPLAG
jgi:hypothetical protein